MSKEKTKKPGINVKKQENFSEWYTQLCDEAKLVDLRYGVQGFVVYNTNGFKLIRKIYELYEQAVEDDGHEPFLFPTVIPKENLEVEKEHSGFTPEVFWLTKSGNDELPEPLAMRPTGETALYPMYAYWIRSHQDLPLKRYQSRISVYRAEKTTRPFLRGREFPFFETHDVFAKHDEALAQISKDMDMMDDIVKKKLLIPFIYIRRSKWEKFLGADDTFAADTIMPDGKQSQLSSTHDLGKNFSTAFKIKFTDKDEKDKFPYQTCFGPGIIRHVAALIGIHGDDKGLVLPSIIAIKEIAIIPIIGKDDAINKKVYEKCQTLAALLKKYKVIYDDSDNTPGFKFHHYELLGVPLRLEIGPHEVEQGKITLARRTSKDKDKIDDAELLDAVNQQLTLLDKEIEKKAEEYFEGNTKNVKSYAELKKIFKTYRGFVKSPFCSIDFDGQKCADQVKTDTLGAKVLGVLFKDPETPDQKDTCIVCKKKAKHIAYLAKCY